jgi:SpoIIAA-like
MMGSYRYRLEQRDGYLYVHQTGTFTTLPQLEELQVAIEAAMDAQGTYRVMFDNREATQAPEDVRAHMWTWLTTTPSVRRAALVANSPRITRRADRTADLNRVSLQAFQSIEDAETWLKRA